MVSPVSRIRVPAASEKNEPTLEAMAMRTKFVAGVNRWCHSRTKRLFDLVFASAALAALSPLLIATLLAVKLTSPGPALFRQQRIGEHGKPFALFKFRSMVHGPRLAGPSLTRVGDPRVTRVGALLRRWKLDELPQLFNVLRGELSMVGPRPHVVELLGDPTMHQRAMLTLRPGVTGLATLEFRDEEDLLRVVDPGQLHSVYCTSILPEKIRLELYYARHASLMRDVTIIAKTASAIFRSVGREYSRPNPEMKAA